MCFSTSVSYFVSVLCLPNAQLFTFWMSTLRVCHSLYVTVTIDTLFVTVCKVICTVDARCFPPISPWDLFLIVIPSPIIDYVLHDLSLSQRLCLFSWEGSMHCMWSCYSCRSYGSFPSLGDKSYVFQGLWSSVQSMSSTSSVSFHANV